MEVRFKTKKLKRCRDEHSFAVRTYGQTTARQFRKVIATLVSTPIFDELKILHPHRFHPLEPRKDNRYSMDLTANYRLIVEPTNNPAQVLVIKIEDTH